MFYSREYQHTLILLQQNEKSTPKTEEGLDKIYEEIIRKLLIDNAMGIYNDRVKALFN